MAQDGGNTLPRIARAEHIGPKDTGDNIEAKRVASYEFDTGTADWQRSGVGYSEFRFDADDTLPNYIGKNVTLNADTAGSDWVIFKFTYSGSAVTRIQKTTGSWDGRAGLF